MKITNKRQFKKLLDEMEKNIPLAKSFTKGLSKSDVNRKWDDIALSLNCLEPPTRSGEEWQKVWRDAKYKVKIKLQHNKRECQGTGGGQYNQKQLSDLEEVISKIVSYDDLINAKGTAIGVSSSCTSLLQVQSKSPSFTYIDPVLSTPAKLSSPVQSTTPPRSSLNPELISKTLTSNSLHLSSTSVSDIPTTSKAVRSVISTDRLDMLRKQTTVQEQLYAEVKESLARIDNHFKETARYERKRYHLEEEKLNLYKIQLEREEKQRIEDNKIKLMEFEIRQRQLDLEERRIKLLERSNE